MGVEIFLDFDYGESDKFLEQDWLFMEFYAILKMGVRIFLVFASGFNFKCLNILWSTIRHLSQKLW